MKKMALFAATALLVLVGAPAVSSAAAIEATVDLSDQQMTVKKHGRVLYKWRVSTARSGYVTPVGSYRPQRMHEMWYSRKYHMSPMPFSIFFHGGYAVHGTNAVSHLGRPASHGCVRLDTSNAHTLYNLVKQYGPGNTKIMVVR